MVKKFVVPLFFVLLSSSCQKEELIDYIPTQTEMVTTEPDTDNSNPEPEKEISNPILHWVSQQQSTSGLLASSEYLDFVSLYDNALAAILLTKNEELSKAERILDFFDSRTQSELESGTGGFYQFRNSLGENGSRRWLGDNAWLLIAIRHYHQASGSEKYSEMALKIENWIRSQQDEDGGLLGGYNEDGSVIPKVTEGIITAFNAVPGYDDFHKNILNYLQTNRWDNAIQNLTAWPENETYTNALDIFALSQSIFEGFPKSSLSIADELFLTSQPMTVTGELITGYCFDEDKDVIWLEGSAQMAIAFKAVGNIAQYELVMEQLEKTFIQSYITSNAKGIPYTTNHGTNYGATVLWDHADITPALSSTIWYSFAKMDFNPLVLGKEKNIPSADKFWSVY